jgi:hypothetical protein
MSDTLLHQIQMEAVDSDYDLASILRKCRVLAQRLNNSDLKLWVVNELEGYRAEDNLPDYRVLSQPLLLGDYFGAFGAQLRNVQIPISAVMEEFREDIMGLKITRGVREIQEQIANSDKGFLKIAVPPEAHAAIRNEQVRADMVLASVVKIVDTSFLQGILDTVRNRILNFTQELESEAPKTGDPLERLRLDKSEKVQQIFNTEIRGDVSNFAQGSRQFTQRFDVPQGNVDALKHALKSIGLDDESIDELATAVREEKPSKQGGFGHRVSAVMGKTFTKASQGLLKVSGSVAADVLTQIVKSYYGI